MTPSNPSDAAELRRLAESRLSEKQKNQRSLAAADRTSHDTQRLVLELQIHQIELEMQNEQLEQARAETETALELYTELYEFAPTGYFTLDHNGTIRQVNLTGSGLLGVDRSRLVNRRFGLFVAERFRNQFGSFVTKVFDSQSRETCEVMLLREGKAPFYARIEAKSSDDGLECRAVVVDVTERKRSEEKIQEQANFLELAHDAIFVRGLDERIRYWNKGAEQLYDWTAEEAIGCDFEKMGHEDRSSFEAAKMILLDGGSWSGEVRKFTKAGKEVVVASRWTLLRDGQGNPKSILVIDTDITEKRQMEAQFRTQRIELIGALAGGIAHDLNNILQVIITNLDLAASSEDSGERLTKYLDDASQGAKRATNLSRRLLTFSKGGAPIKQPLDVAEVLTHAVLLALSGSKLKSQFAFQRDLYPVIGDPVQLTQVFENIVINACEATPRQGKLFVRAENVDQEIPTSSGLPIGRYVRIEIEDNGAGIPANILDRIFEPCFTTKPGGSGLGLPTVKSIMLQHGGDITIESRSGHGTTASLMLPASGHRPEPPAATLPPPVVKATGRILVIDDEEMILSVVSSMLHTLGYECAVAVDGVKGCDEYVRAKADGDPFSAVLLDATIPNGISGEEALKLLLAKDPDARVILCSGYADGDLFEKAEQLGFKAFLAKPFSISEFISVFNKVLS
ncbi:MAG TPA: ATP-binding protein [Chthoniobacterales bacterium]|jgi:two-component system, cell cycle sensor histidine kinase and response regulator CckA|nr:ATP-binding protein [Chthoniobacterales bacterium]